MARFPLRYDPQFCGRVFPLAMCITASPRLIEALTLGFMRAVPAMFIRPAPTAWLAMLATMLIHLAEAAHKAD